jgi:hypothetical protein
VMKWEKRYTSTVAGRRRKLYSKFQTRIRKRIRFRWIY